MVARMINIFGLKVDHYWNFSINEAKSEAAFIKCENNCIGI
jgi:hypothetical protein